MCSYIGAAMAGINGNETALLNITRSHSLWPYLVKVNRVYKLTIMLPVFSEYCTGRIESNKKDETFLSI
ncbi:hypothetical protein GCM10027342_23600 [Photobacterium alginatilyticum]